MRLCDFLDKLHGDLIVKIFTENENGYFNELLRENKIKDLERECADSFNILVGFNDKLWEMQVVKWSIYDNVDCGLNGGFNNEIYNHYKT